MYTTGQVVFSKSGRDKGLAFMVVATDENFVYLVDGKCRKLEKPKKKKKMHVQITKFVNEEIKQKIDNNLYLNNADIKKALEAYRQG